MSGLVADHCSRCGLVKRPGDIFYLARIILTCDFDGELAELKAEEASAGMSAEMAKASARSEEELMNEVYQELYFYLCKGCRDRFVKRAF